MATSRQQSGGTRRNNPQPSRPTSAPSSRSRGAPRSRAASAGNGAAKPAAERPAPRATAGSSSNPSASKLAKPIAAGGAALAAIIGGAILGAKALPRKRSFPASLGHQLTDLGKNVDVKKARKQLGHASRQFGALTRELRKAGEQAERIGDALS